MYRGKPIIGVVGGIGSGKSFVASLFGELGAMVIRSDEQVREAYRDPAVKAELRRWWGEEVFAPDGEVDRRAIAARVFSDDAQRLRLEQLLHPWVARARDAAMAAAPDSVAAFVWDTPLLLETGLERQCDAVVFVDAPVELRQQRVRERRGWDEAELLRREKFQMPLDKKRAVSHYVLQNTADAGLARGQVREILSRILASVR